MVAVEGSVVRDQRQALNGGERIRVELPEPISTAARGEEMPLRVLYEDNDLLVLDKPAGVVVHPAPGNETGTLVNALIAHCGDSLSGIGGERRPGIVHRLDKDTSGVMVVAKNDQAHRGLAEQFAAHGKDGRLKRAYLALVWGVPERDRGSVSVALARSATNRRKIAVSRGSNGRHAVTHFEVLERYGTPGVVSLIECRLETGRTHQIRVHMAHIGHPLLGDPVYGTGFKASERKLPETARNALKALNRQALHAYELGFEHPRTGQPMRFTSPPPSDLNNLIAALAPS